MSNAHVNRLKWSLQCQLLITIINLCDLVTVAWVWTCLSRCNVLPCSFLCIFQERCNPGLRVDMWVLGQGSSGSESYPGALKDRHIVVFYISFMLKTVNTSRLLVHTSRMTFLYIELCVYTEKSRFAVWGSCNLETLSLEDFLRKPLIL